ncbi:hypothetical protein [Methanobrevibacter millerae]|uniref:Uncharacterized protein n=1 Tax=Methanobrevibacter millerae TaxID=230361 RepID=A0A1G5V955_9EURY|nr:hypothetical protein [Methanobrevibacter millerae]SDA42413.1 hypothetical protein SAMN02910315_00444 [Methanobrevibacter millerae]
MEISRIINNLEDFNQVSSDNELDLIIEDLSKFSYKDYIYIEYVGNSENLDVRELLRKLINKIEDTFKEDSIEKKVAIIKSIISIFQKGLNEINLSYFFVFLYANSRINLPIGELVNKYNLNEGFNEILIKISEILNNVKIHVTDEALSMYFDKFNALNEEETLITSIIEIDFEKYNPLIRNNKFLLPNHFYQMIEVLQKYNFELFKKLLTSNNVFSLVLIVKCMSFNQITSFFVNHDEIKEKTLLCFLMKFLRASSDDIENYYNMVVEMCIRLYQLNKTLFIELMDIFMYNEFFNGVMGAMFCKLSKEDLNILIEPIPLNDNVKLIDVRIKMLNECYECENSEYIFELIYKKWENYLLNSFNEKNKALNILCTDFCNFIIAYYFHKYDNDKLLDSMKELFDKLKNLDSEWSYNIIHHRNKFFVYYSKLFIFSALYEFNKMNDDEIKVYYNEFYESYVLFKKFLDNKKENFLDRIEENLLGNNSFKLKYK